MNVPITVEVETNAEDLPTGVRYREDTGDPPSAARAFRRVENILEVWRIDDEWWRRPITRRYVDVVLDEGTHVVLFEDLGTGVWFAQQP